MSFVSSLGSSLTTNFTRIQFGGLQWMHSGLELANFLQKLSIFDKLQQFLSNLFPSFSVFNQFWFLKRIFLYVIIKGLWSCYLRMAFWDGDNFCKAFAGALVNMSYHSWLRHSWYDKFTCAPAKALQKLSPSRKTTLLHILVQEDFILLFFP